MKDIHGKAILDFYKNRNSSESLTLHTSYDMVEEVPIEVFFREQIDYTTIEHLAIMECKGSILDIGAGAGTHSLVLQNLGLDVFALDNSQGCIEVMRHSGIKKIINEDYRKHQGRYDTLLLLMNGLGIAGTLDKVPTFLKKCKTMLKPKGQILLDSSDISYLYQDLPKPADYYGNIRYQYEYEGKKGDWFEWVYVDQQSLKEIAANEGFEVELLIEDEEDQYLACLTLS